MSHAADLIDKSTDMRFENRLLNNYAKLTNTYDELLDENDKIRPHWRPFIQAIYNIGEDNLNARFQIADRYLRDSGVYHRVYLDARSTKRDWPLSHIPLILTPDDWQQLKSGLTQRAEILEKILSDVYGLQTLIESKRIPAAMIAGNPDFLRPLVNIKPRGGHYLRFYAVDVGRGPDGKWWVLNDRAQTPSGAGYALENRIALSRALPDIYRALNVQRLAKFFQNFRQSLAKFNRSDDARICLISPGSLNETYFEHAYLARYLGFLLVEGEDLCVRNDEVFVRTVSGLKRADVIWRRLDSDYIDPLELNAKSHLGVPGFVSAVRKHGVMLANSLGAGLVESLSMMSLMADLSRHLLKQDLILPDIASWWCGDKASKKYVLDNFDTLVIAPAFEKTHGGIIASATEVTNLDQKMRAKLREAIISRGEDYVGQENVKLSTIPVWKNKKFEPHPYILRLFLARTEQGWTVMPGGFCRVSDSTDSRAISMQHGGLSADVWVGAQGRVEEVSLLTSPEAVKVVRQPGFLPSRTADNLFWLGRYIERAEGCARLVRTLLLRVNDAMNFSDPNIQALIFILKDFDAVSNNVANLSPIDIAGFIIHDQTQKGALLSLFNSAREAASVIRDRFSPDAWRTINEILALLSQPKPFALSEGETLAKINMVLQLTAAFSGYAQENMNRLNGWRFLEIGRRIERALITCKFIRKFAITENYPDALDNLLELADSQITYRLRYVTMAAKFGVVDLVMLDGNNPRSVAFQIDKLENHLSRLPNNQDSGMRSASERIMIKLGAKLKTLLAEEISEDDILSIEKSLMKISDEISLRYFTHQDGLIYSFEKNQEQKEFELATDYEDHNL